MKSLARPNRLINPQLISHFLNAKWFIVAIVVGSILNLINQYDALFNWQLVSYPKLILTYAVPYWVSSLSALSALTDEA